MLKLVVVVFAVPRRHGLDALAITRADQRLLLDDMLRRKTVVVRSLLTHLRHSTWHFLKYSACGLLVAFKLR
jgi:hypothetical protein